MSSDDKEKLEKNDQNEVEKKEVKDEGLKETTEVTNNEKKENNIKEEKEVKSKKDEFIENALKKRAKRKKICIIIVIVIIILLIFSTIFALINVNKATYLHGIKVNEISISGLSKTDAKNKVEEEVNAKINSEVCLVDGEKEILTIKPEEIELNYNVNDTLKQAYEIGRNGNIFENNFTILKTMLFGKELKMEHTYNEEELQKKIDEIDGNIEGLVIEPSYYREDNDLIIVPGKDGIIVEKDKLKEQIIQKIDSITAEDIKNNKYDAKLQVPKTEKVADPINIEEIYNEVKCEPKNASFTEEPFELFLDEDGIDFAITLEEAKKIIEEKAEEYKIPLKITKADITVNDIGAEAFKYKVSTFSTNYDPGYTSRVNNLRLAAGKINGKVLKPGDIFSFNEVVGKRTIEAGYTDAKIFVNGEVVDGTGGGICQVSTTLYNAALLANLEIVDRRNHNYTTSYIRPGRDATVVYGAIDFKFKNTRKYPIKLESSVSGGVISFTIYGIEQENEYDVKIIPIDTGTIPKATEYIDDPTLPAGSEVVKQAGTTGCKVTTYKEVYLNGALQSKEVISNDTYKAMSRIIRRGTAAASVPTSAPEQTPQVIQEPSVPEPTPVPTPTPTPVEKQEPIVEPTPTPEPPSTSDTTV